MLNYNTYKTLTKEQKEEYNFKIKNVPRFNVLTPTIMLGLVITLAIVISAFGVLTMYSPEFSEILSGGFFIDIVATIAILLNVVSWLIAFAVIEYAFLVLRRAIIFFKFTKKHKIKFKKFNYLWTKW